MKKINFNQPRYILPIILVPFFYIFNYLFAIMLPEEKGSDLTIVDQFNSQLPAPNLDKSGVMNKFDSFKEVYKNRQDYSAVLDLERNENFSDISNLSDSSRSIDSHIKDQEIADSIATAIMEGTLAVAPLQSTPSNLLDLRQPSKQLRANDPPKSAATAQDDVYEKEMRMFRAQMDYIDSLTNESDPSTGKNEPVEARVVESQKDTLAQVAQVALKVKRTSQNSAFNTLKADKSSSLIEAIIDEELTIKEGSRIRIRLLDAIWVGEILLPKGQSLFGKITGFSAERIYISITSALVNGTILPVDLHVYDNDGLKGIYVPKNAFSDVSRTVSADMIANSQIRDNQKLLASMATGAFNTASKAVSRAIRKNKAQLKYSTIIYLVNP